MFVHKKYIGAISRIALAVAVIIVIVVAAAGAVYLSTSSRSTSTTSSTTSTSSSNETTSSSVTSSPTSSTGASSSTSSPSTSSSSSSLVSTTVSSSSTSSALQSSLIIDDNLWPGVNGDPLAATITSVYPTWEEGAVYQTLIGINLNSEQNLGQLVFAPDLASSWTVSPNGENYTFQIRPGVTFSNGDTFNAYEEWFNFYFNYYIQSNSSSFWSFGLAIFNTTGIDFGPATLAMVNQSNALITPSQQLLSMMENKSWPVYVESASSITFQLDSPYPFFLSTLVGVNGPVIDAASVIKNGGPGTPGVIDSYFTNNLPFGTGPYTVSQIQQNDYMVFKKNPTYWGNNLTSAEITSNPVIDPGHYQSITVWSKSDDVSRYTDLSSGAAQISAVTSSDFQLVASNPSYGIAQMKYPALQTFLVMNNLMFPTNITLVRQAIVHAINYSALIQTAALGYGSRYLGPETPNYGQYYDPGNVTPYQYNVTLAENDLAAAGYKNGTGLPTLSFQIAEGGSSWQVPGSEIIQQDLAQIGININLNVVTNDFFYQYDGNYQSIVNASSQLPNLKFDDPSGYAPDYISPTDFWVGFVTNFSGYGNFGSYNNPQVDLAVQNWVSHNYASNASILQQLVGAEQQIYNDAPYAWLFLCQLPLIDGSYVYKANVIGGFYIDYNLIGATDVPLLNTVYPAS